MANELLRYVELGPQLTTELSAEYKTGQTVLHLASVTGWQTEGEGYVAGERFTYTGISGTELTGVTGLAANHANKSEVFVRSQPKTLLDLNEGVHYILKADSFKQQAPVLNAVVAEDERRWGGGRQVAATSENGAIEWVAGVSGESEQECIERIEAMLAQLEANPYTMYILWQVPGGAHPTLYQVRGTATWSPEYEWAPFQGANFHLFTVKVPVAPLAQALPIRLYEKSALTLPELLTLGTIPGDAPAKAEVTIETGNTLEESFITGQHSVQAICADASHIYWTQNGTGFLGRSALNGTSVEPTWVNTGGNPVGLAIDASHIYWTDSSTGKVGRCTIAGATIEKEWLKPTSSAVHGIAVDASHVYIALTNRCIGRAAITGGAVEEGWIKVEEGSETIEGLAVDSGHVYWTTGEYIGRAAIGGTAVEKHFIKLIGEHLSNYRSINWVAIDSEHIYVPNVNNNHVERWSLTGDEPEPYFVATAKTMSNALAVAGGILYLTCEFRGAPENIARITVTSPPAFALLSSAVKPSAGLARGPLGIFTSTEAVQVHEFALSAEAGARGGKVLQVIASEGSAAWEVDPSTMVPDAYTGEIQVEVWARLLCGESLKEFQAIASAQPQDGPAYGAIRYTDEWGSAGRPVTVPAGNIKYRMTRLGTIRMLVNPLSPRIWNLVVQLTCLSTATKMGIDYLMLCPVLQRSCGPSGKVNGETYPRFAQTAQAISKTIKSDLTALTGKPGKNGHPDVGLGGQLLEVPPGEAQLLAKLCSMVPDDPTELNNVSEQLAYSNTKVTVWVTPRFYLARTV